MRDDLQQLRDKTIELELKMDRVSHQQHQLRKGGEQQALQGPLQLCQCAALQFVPVAGMSAAVAFLLGPTTSAAAATWLASFSTS